MERRLAAILAADVVGYSRMMGRDETGTLRRLNSIRKEVFEPTIARFGGRIVKLMGDGALVEFGSTLGAVEAATAIQRSLAARASDEAHDEPIALRIGINVGDVIHQDRDIFGDGVNIAARLESIAPAGGISVSGAVFDHVESKLDLQFDDHGMQTLKNVERPVRVYQINLDETPARSVRRADVSTAMARPAIAVLPFTNMSHDQEQEYFADGLSEDLITVLSHWRSFPVIARNSTFTYKGQSVNIPEVGTALGARYVLEGSVRKAGQRIRITAQLIDAETGHHVWAEKFDRQLDDIFDIQDEITVRIAATIAPELEQVERRKSARRRSEDLTAWDYYVRGMEYFNLETKEGYPKARDYFEKAVARDPNYADAWARLGWTYLREYGDRHVDERDAWLDKGFDLARHAISLDEASAIAHLCLGTAYIWSNRLEEGLAGARRALELNPSYAHAALALGNRLDLVGRTEEGIAEMQRGMQLSPRDPHGWSYVIFLSRAHIALEDYDKALEFAHKATQLRASLPDPHFRLAICLAHLDRVDEARAALAECIRLDPEFLVRRTGWKPYSDDDRNKKFFAGLRRHGLMDNQGRVTTA